MIKNKDDAKRTFAIIAGHLLEHYDITLYGFFAAMLGPLFFPENDHVCATLFSFGVFAAGFLMRPFGGFIFGYIGDKYGRKKALLFSILLVTLPTFSIGFLPTYAQIGILSPILLIFFRLLQGLCVGGEFSGALIYVSEHSKNLKPGLKASILIMSGFFGAILGTLVGWASTKFCELELSSSLAKEWGWRIPFILGGIFGLIVLLLRKSLKETPDFESFKEYPVQGFPLLKVLRYHPLPFICTIIYGGSNLVALYLGTVYMNSILSDTLHFTRPEILQNSTFCLLFCASLIPIFGWIGDKVGIVRSILWGCALITLGSIPFYAWAFQTPIVTKRIYVLQGFLMLCNACVIGPLASFIPRIFPKHLRYSGMSVSFTTGQAILGGVTPMIASYITSTTNLSWSPGIFLFVVSIFFGSAVALASKYCIKHD
jgi:MHS family proline/betaine transporter-like MFS transporter